MTSSQLSEWMAYFGIHPIDPGLETMLAQQTNVAARVAGNDTKPSDFTINQLADPDESGSLGDELAEMLRARAKKG